MPSFYIPLSGLQADSQALNTIANNLTNLNTTAYKEVTTNFSDLFYSNVGTTGGGDSISVGQGVQVASNTTNFTQGSYNTSNTSSSDMAIDGNGFFVLNNNGSYLYTRNGAFTESSTGVLESSSGLALMGYSATNGVVNTTGALSEITLPTSGSVMQPSASTSFAITGNLDSAAAVGDTYTTSVTVYDSQGTTHSLSVTYTKTGTNTWDYSASLPASDYTSGTSTAVTGSLSFDANGNLTTVTNSSGTTSTVGSATGDTSAISMSFTGLADGASDLSLSWNLLNSSNTTTLGQIDSDSKISSATANGYATGTYQSFTVDSDGTVEAKYSNGETQAVGQVALANFTNLQGLEKDGSSNYSATLSSGSASISTPDSGGMGTIKDSALEQSNVDISTEFSNLIIAQRAFEASSKAVTTFDTIASDTIGLIR